MKTLLYVVGKKLEGFQSWEFIGVFADESMAILACTTDAHFIGPTVLNQNVGDEQIPWPDAWYPLLESRPEETKCAP